MFFKLFKYLGVSFLLFGCKTPQQPLTIATAANMQFAMEALCTEFTKQTGIECQLVVSSSGKLTAQIQAGAPYDVFASADLKYPTTLYHRGFTTQAPKVYAMGTLVLWTTKNDYTPTLQTLKDSTIKHIAIANPKTAPYGKAALEVLHPINTSIENKLVYGESIAQVNQFVSTQAAQVGFTSLAVVLAQQTGYWFQIPKNRYTPIAQGMVVIKNSKHVDQANQFYSFVFSNKGKEILKQFGCN